MGAPTEVPQQLQTDTLANGPAPVRLIQITVPINGVATNVLAQVVAVQSPEGFMWDPGLVQRVVSPSLNDLVRQCRSLLAQIAQVPEPPDPDTPFDPV